VQLNAKHQGLRPLTKLGQFAFRPGRPLSGEVDGNDSVVGTNVTLKEDLFFFCFCGGWQKGRFRRFLSMGNKFRAHENTSDSVVLDVGTGRWFLNDLFGLD